MDLTNYRERKKKGHIELQKVGDAFVMVSKQFDATTGEARPSSVAAVDRENIVTRRTEIADKLMEIDAFLKDLEALGKPAGK